MNLKKERLYKQIRKSQLRTKYGLSVNAYASLYKAQKGKCAICKCKQKRRLAVDHEHDKKVVRGLLCISCNIGLGYFYDNKKFLSNASKYLADD